MADMYVEGKHTVSPDSETAKIMFPEPGHPYCKSQSPDERWICTRAEGHDSIHIAATGPVTFEAIWWYDPHVRRDEDFFAALGL